MVVNYRTETMRNYRVINAYIRVTIYNYYISCFIYFSIFVDKYMQHTSVIESLKTYSL